MADSWYATAFGAFYPVLYGHRDDEEAERLLRLLRTLCPLRGPVLDLGCGDGRHLVRLEDAVGLDLSAELLRAARRRTGGSGVKLVRGDLRDLPFADATCGSVLSLFTAFGYFADAAGNEGPVAEIARILVPGGHWCLDYFDADRVLAELGNEVPVRRQREAGPLVVNEIRYYDSTRRIVQKMVVLKPLHGAETDANSLGVGREGVSYTEEVMVFSLEELDGMAARSDLHRVAAAGSYGGAPLGEGDRWLLVYARGNKGGAP